MPRQADNPAIQRAAFPRIKCLLTSPHVRHAGRNRQRQIEFVPNEMNAPAPDFAAGGLFEKYRQSIHTLTTSFHRASASGAESQPLIQHLMLLVNSDPALRGDEPKAQAA